MKVIKKVYSILADTVIAFLLSLIAIVVLYAFFAIFSDAGAKGMTYIKSIYFYFVIEHVVSSLILVIVVMIFITPRLFARFD
ncbi:hypothetical protein ACEU8E_002480 [Staphylococcus pseudintermedius]|uniref:hypothetical protein n=1 Tax=Staphylococcus TaxID=1279 RepID=UPI00112046E4|nr:MULTISPECIES: hypothetical protein [Staphylococcus]MBW5882103.1 hypothetical protein [Staphylococcus aureus]TOZ68287.1 hypothetical protein DJ442_12415 [Staphylococcus pseudintermedius]